MHGGARFAAAVIAACLSFKWYSAADPICQSDKTGLLQLQKLKRFRALVNTRYTSTITKYAFTNIEGVFDVSELFEFVAPLPQPATSLAWLPCLSFVERQSIAEVLAEVGNFSAYLASGLWDRSGKWAIPEEYWEDWTCDCPNCEDEELLLAFKDAANLFL
ncbi:unnamed protein product [Symbiodinium sp. CCMP2592]|nr:unnamed protein product [Symbiodinium sp. CCMP2592]